MADTVTMPKLGFDMAEGTLIRWVIQEGQPVAKGAVLAEIETDKATVEVQSTFEGTLRKQLVNEGDVVPVGTPIAVVGSPDEKIEDQVPSKQEVIETSMESTAGGFTQKELATGGQKEEPGMVGKTAAPGQPAAQGTSPAEAAAAEARKDVQEAPAPAAPAPAEEEGAEPVPGLPGGVRASPVARKMAEERGVDLRRVRGSGPDGRITKKDVETYAVQAPAGVPAPAPAAAVPAAAPQPASAPAAGAKAPAPLPPLAPLAVGPAPADTTIPLNRLRGAIGRRMVESKQQAPHFYVTHEYDMEALMALRKQVNAMLRDEEKVSVNDFVVKAVALNLHQFPNLNASLNGDQVVRHGQINIGVAVAVENGLLTVVCRDADRKPLRQIAVEVRGMAERARAGKVRPEDIEGSTFSTSNLGMYEVESFIAILNPPEAGILAVGSVREAPVVKDGEIKPGMRMKATISVDHRVSDGAEAARFLQALAPYLEEPMRLLL